jgi:hypothetical protein
LSIGGSNDRGLAWEWEWKRVAGLNKWIRGEGKKEKRERKKERK